MQYIDLPNINRAGTTEQQLSEIRTYIYRNNEQLNAVLSNLTVDKIWEQTANALAAAYDENSNETKDLLERYAAIRDLIIKTADVIIQTDEQFKMTMTGSFLAKSQFGEYLRNTSVEIDGNSTGFTELYRYSTELGTEFDEYTTDMQNYIKRGLLDESVTPAVYGIEIGLISSKITYNGREIDTSSNIKTRITPDEMSWWSNGNKVYYINGKTVYFPSAEIYGGYININDNFIVDPDGNVTIKRGSININNKFRVDSEGNLTATSGKIGDVNISTFKDDEWVILEDGKTYINGAKIYTGSVSADSISAKSFQTAFNGISSYMQLQSGEIDFYDSSKKKTAVVNKDGIHFYRNGNYIGKIGTNHLKGHDDIRGLVFDLEPTGHYMSLAYEEVGGDSYINMFTFSRGGGEGNNIYAEKGLHLGTDLYGHNCKIHDVHFDGYISSGGVSCVKNQSIPYISEIVSNANGSITWTQRNLEVRNGLIVSW